mgnify:FL=1
MSQFLKGLITGGFIVLVFFTTVGQVRFKLSEDDKKYYTEKGWVQSLFDLEINIGERVDALSRLLALEVNDIEDDISALKKRLEQLEEN